MVIIYTYISSDVTIWETRPDFCSFIYVKHTMDFAHPTFMQQPTYNTEKNKNIMLIKARKKHSRCTVCKYSLGSQSPKKTLCFKCSNLASSYINHKQWKVMAPH